MNSSGPRNDAGVQKLEVTRCGVARVGERFVTRGAEFLPKTAKAQSGHVDLSAHLEHGGGHCSPQLPGDGPHGLEILRDVIAPFPVAASRPAHPHPSLVA